MRIAKRRARSINRPTLHCSLLRSSFQLSQEEDKPPLRPSVPSPDADIGKIIPFYNSFTPLMPPVQFKFWQCKTQPISKPSAKQTTSNKYLYYKAECEQLLDLVQDTVAKVSGCESRRNKPVASTDQNLIALCSDRRMASLLLNSVGRGREASFEARPHG